MKFVEQHRGDAVERGIVKHQPREYALGDHLDARAFGYLGAEAHAQAHRIADLLAKGRGHARGGGARMASTLGEQVGDTVGLRVRFGSKISKRTRIEVITEGIFTRLVLDDPSLDGVAAVP